MVANKITLPREAILEGYRLADDAVNLEPFLTEHRYAGFVFTPHPWLSN